MLLELVISIFSCQPHFPERLLVVRRFLEYSDQLVDLGRTWTHLGRGTLGGTVYPQKCWPFFELDLREALFQGLQKTKGHPE